VNDDLDNKLRKALRPVDPGEEFTARVLARAAEEGAGGERTAPPRKVPRFVWVPAALAASVALVVVVAHVWREQQEATGLAARDQVMDALRMTSEKLDLAYEIVNHPAPSPEEDGSGA
jgi:hypothetical protein